MIKKIILLFILFFDVAFSGEPLSVLGDWTIFTMVNSDKKLLCYAVVLPQKRYDNFNKRGQSFFSIIKERGNNNIEIYLSYGQLWKRGVKYAELDIVKRKFPLYVYEDKAWAYNTYDDKNIINELSKSTIFSLSVDFYGDKKLIDIYSLNGFNEAMEEINRLCEE